ncbi:Calcineurin-like phosphoesterase superfamily domain [[Flavobacterium] thermophilum]|nr:Calcineurin-like phosphoesterase superfamily domain [[Flavobacterium] thermophilum]
MEYKRKPSESLDEYKIRLCRNKDLYDLRWQDISELWYEETGEQKSPDWFRKFYRYFNEGYECALKENPTNEEYIKELEEKKIEFEKAKYQYQDQRREYNKLIREQARIDHVRNTLVQEVRKLNNTKPLQWYERVVYSNSDNREALLLISDTHYGKFANNHWNQFNNDEFKRRMKVLISKTIQYSKEHRVKTLNVFILGDLIEGLLHNITRITSTEDAVSQTIHISEILSEVLCELANEFEQLKVYNCRGNHERAIQNKKEEIAKESFNDLIIWYLKARLGNVKNIQFMNNEIDDEIIVADILGYKIFGVHGHRDKVSDVVQNLTLMTKIFPDYVCMGHYHHHEENEVHGVEVIMNSSFAGTDEYTKNIRKTSKAAQKLIIFDKDEGRLCTYNIILNKKEKFYG